MTARNGWLQAYKSTLNPTVSCTLIVRPGPQRIQHPQKPCIGPYGKQTTKVPNPGGQPGTAKGGPVTNPVVPTQQYRRPPLPAYWLSTDPPHL